MLKTDLLHVTKLPQGEIIFGPRGSGKTTALVHKYLKTDDSVFICAINKPHVIMLISRTINIEFANLSPSQRLDLSIEKKARVFTHDDFGQKLRGIHPSAVFIDEYSYFKDKENIVALLNVPIYYSVTKNTHTPTSVSSTALNNYFITDEDREEMKIKLTPKKILWWKRFKFWIKSKVQHYRH
jgi:hypothetical protein